MCNNSAAPSGPRALFCLFVTAAFLSALVFAPQIALAQIKTTPAPVTATVTVSALNLRSGPGTTFARKSLLKSGALLSVDGQSNFCAWLRVRTASGLEGWVSGNTRYVKLSAPCTDLPSVTTASATPAATATPEPGTEPVALPTTTPTPADLATAAPTPTAAPTSAPTAAPTAGAQKPFPPAGQGCIRFGNYVGPELTITLTNQADGKSSTSKLPDSETVILCLEASRYSFTVDAPPPFGSLNFEVTVAAGELYDYPFTARP